MRPPIDLTWSADRYVGISEARGFGRIAEWVRLDEMSNATLQSLRKENKLSKIWKRVCTVEVRRSSISSRSAKDLSWHARASAGANARAAQTWDPNSDWKRLQLTGSHDLQWDVSF